MLVNHTASRSKLISFGNINVWGKPIEWAGGGCMGSEAKIKLCMLPVHHAGRAWGNQAMWRRVICTTDCVFTFFLRALRYVTPWPLIGIVSFWMLLITLAYVYMYETPQLNKQYIILYMYAQVILTGYYSFSCFNGIWNFSIWQQGLDKHLICSFEGKFFFLFSQHTNLLLLNWSVITIHFNNVRFCQLKMEANRLPIHTESG